MGPGTFMRVGWSRDDRDLLYAHETPWSPPDLYRRGIAAAAKAKRLTHSAHAYFREADTSERQQVSFRSADGLEVPGYLLTPRNMPASARLPAVVALHPNSYGQHYFDNWNPFYQQLVAQGYAVLMVDQRGGSGYGRKFS